MLHFCRDINNWADRMKKIVPNFKSASTMEIASCPHLPKFLIFTVGSTWDRSVNGTYAGEIINHCRPETLSAFIQFPDQSFVLLQTANRCLFNTLAMIMTRLGKKKKRNSAAGRKKIPTARNLCIHLSRFSVWIYLRCRCRRVDYCHQPPVLNYVKSNNSAS